MSKKKEEIEAEIGSGNLFEDLGYRDPAEAQLKADLAMQIHQIIRRRKLNQKKAAELMEIDQPKVSDILRGKLSKYSVGRLMHFIRRLGKDIEIHIKTHKEKSIEPWIHVVNRTRSRSRKTKSTSQS